MTDAPTPSEIRDLLLEVISAIAPAGPNDPPLQQNTLFGRVRHQLQGRLTPETEQEVLSQWHHLVTTGYVAWGSNLDNPNSPFFHVTTRGNGALQQLSRDPANPRGYLQHVGTVATLNPIANSYLLEGLACYTAGLYKSAAVMLGASSESLILELRDAVVTRLAALSRTSSRSLTDWRAKTVLDALHTLLDGKKADFNKELREEFEAYFLAFAQQIRSARNDAGHPSSIDPVTEQGVHASFLIFPELARLNSSLAHWVSTSLT